MSILLELIIKILMAYLLGSLLGSLIIGKLKGGVDIRQHGSGNAGGTNALRTQGWQFALCVMVIDVGKGWFAAAYLARWSIPAVPSTVSTIWLQVGCAMAVVVGHVWPLWFGFRGGKGAATLAGVVVGIAPTALPSVLVAWLLVLLLSGFVGLSTMLATLSFNLWVWLAQPVDSQPLQWFGLVMLLLVVFTHRGNIKRMLAGTENRARKLWLFKPRA
ncbi:MAG: glycerol-3-phosphate 1-O-acyltransferase PlsY [Steroidobacteraceae bacterium]